MRNNFTYRRLQTNLLGQGSHVSRLYRKIFGIVLVLFAAGACAQSAVSPATLEVITDWSGKYQPFSKACKNYPITVDATTLTYGTCKHSILETLVKNSAEFTVRVRAETGCGWSDSIISLRKPNGGGGVVDFLNFKSVEDYKKNNFPVFCAYGARE